MAPENMNPQDYTDGFPTDLPELKAFLSDLPVYHIMPELEIEPASCSCCWEWTFTAPQAQWTGSAYTNYYVIPYLWELLWSLVNTDTTDLDDFILVTGDQEAFCFGIEKTADEQVNGWFYHAYEGDSRTPPTRLAFSCPALDFVAQLSSAMGAYARAYCTDVLRDLEYNNEYNQLYTTLRYWPWHAFPIWYQLKNKLPLWQAYWLTFITLAKEPEMALKQQDADDYLGHLIFQLHWNTFLLSLLEDAFAYCETASVSTFEQMKNTYATQLEEIHTFINALDGQWEKGKWYHGGRDEEFLNYCVENPDYALLSYHKYLTNLRWWPAQMSYCFRRCVPELYDWQQRKSWEEQLDKTHPEVYTALNLRWRQNRIWQASFEREI